MAAGIRPVCQSGVKGPRQIHRTTRSDLSDLRPRDLEGSTCIPMPYALGAKSSVSNIACDHIGARRKVGITHLQELPQI